MDMNRDEIVGGVKAWMMRLFIYARMAMCWYASVFFVGWTLVEGLIMEHWGHAALSLLAFDVCVGRAWAAEMQRQRHSQHVYLIGTHWLRSVVARMKARIEKHDDEAREEAHINGRVVN